MDSEAGHSNRAGHSSSGLKMLIGAQSKKRGERGSALLEGALCLTVFLMIVFGTIDFGRMVFAYNFVSYAAREATRYAAVHGTAHAVTNDDITTFVTRQAIALKSSAMTCPQRGRPTVRPAARYRSRFSTASRRFCPTCRAAPSGSAAPRRCSSLSNWAGCQSKPLCNTPSSRGQGSFGGAGRN